MGAYTANYLLYLCAAGEQGWGDAINGNFETVDAELKEHADSISDLETRKPQLSEVQADAYGAITGIKTFAAMTATTYNPTAGMPLSLGQDERSTGIVVNYAAGLGSAILSISASASSSPVWLGDKYCYDRGEVAVILRNGNNFYKTVLLAEIRNLSSPPQTAHYSGQIDLLSSLRNSGAPVGSYTVCGTCKITPHGLSTEPTPNGAFSGCSLVIGSGSPTTFVITNDFDLLTTKLP